METLPKDATSSANATLQENISSIYSFDDLAETKTLPVRIVPRQSLLTFIICVAAAASAYFFLSGCSSDNGFRCASSSAANRQILIPSSVNKSLDPWAIQTATAYSAQKNTPFLIGAPVKFENFKNLQLTFFRSTYLTTYMHGVNRTIAVHYVTKGVPITVEFPYNEDAELLYSDGTLSTKPFYTDYSGFLSTILPQSPVTFGILTGSLTSEEKAYCDSTPNLCTIVDVYQKNRPQVDKFLSGEVAESTMTLNLPIYFVGVDR